MELKVGMYVRTYEGYIAKLLHYGYNNGIAGKSHLFDSSIRDITNLIYDSDNFLFDNEISTYIKNFNDNPIDLIEEGDYVNGYRVTYVYPNLIKVDSTDIWEIHPHDIKSIVTKEQFESIKYEVE